MVLQSKSLSSSPVKPNAQPCSTANLPQRAASSQGLPQREHRIAFLGLRFGSDSHTHIYIYIHTYIHAYIHTYIHTCSILHNIPETMHIYVIYMLPPHRSMDFRLLGGGRLRVFSNYLFQNAVSMKIP